MNQPIRIGHLWRDPLLATILMTAVTILLAVVLWFMVTHLIGA